MNSFISLCALSAILVAVLTIIKADSADMNELKAYIKTIREEQAEIRSVVSDGFNKCIEKHYKEELYYACTLVAGMLTNALDRPYDKAVIFIKNHMDKLESESNNSESFDPKKVMQLALGEMIEHSQKTASKLLDLEQDSVKNIDYPQAKVWGIWDTKWLFDLQKGAYMLYKEYAV